MSPVVLISVAVIVLLVVVGFAMYNGLVKARLRVREAWSAVQVQLQRAANAACDRACGGGESRRGRTDRY